MNAPRSWCEGMEHWHAAREATTCPQCGALCCPIISYASASTLTVWQAPLAEAGEGRG